MSSSRKDSKSKNNQTDTVKAYLVAYNLLSALGWSYLLLLTLRHLFSSYPATTAASLHSRAITTYASVGPVVAVIQTSAILELVHVLFGWVRSPLTTTFMQVYSRLYVVWAVTERFESAQANPLYASMIISWCITEIIRYSYYALSVMSIESKMLTYLRYTTFYLLYPTGAGSEVFLIFATAPTLEEMVQGKASLLAIWRFIMFVIWWPSLYILYTHMRVQRRKVLGGSSSKSKKAQ